ncbi:MAG: MaoC/PaaZ C-terminal domain-containing protein [bacterium]|nr:MaoC/PaaZ C-terminal domain-containing protein [bacterium]
MSDEINALAADPELWHLEDYAEALEAGRRLEGGRYVVTEEEILEFGRRFDPQPMHTDPVAAKDGPFGGLVAPGCLTFAIRNALHNQLPVRPALYAGLGLDQLLLPSPVRPGDVLSLRLEVVEARRSKSRPETGVVQTRQTVLNQAEETVLTMDAKMIVRARNAS